MKIPFYMITGFLGSGKTTFLKHILDENKQTKRIAIVQNEFAAASVDGADLRQSGKSFEILEINKGSVFCVCLLSDFVQSLKDFIEQYHPDIVILESSGLSDPIAIAQLLDSVELKDLVYLAYVWCIIDGVNFFKGAKMVNRTSHQIRVADKIVINKCDLASDLNTIEEYVKEVNPFAQIEQTSFCKLDLRKVFEEEKSIPIAIRNKEQNKEYESCGRPELQSAVLRTTHKTSYEKLVMFLEKKSPQTIRMKGFVLLTDGRTAALQASYGKYEINFVDNYFAPTEMVAMGEGIDKEFFGELVGGK